MYSITFTQMACPNRRNQDALFNGVETYQFKNKKVEDFQLNQDGFILGVMDGVSSSPQGYLASYFWAEQLKTSQELSKSWLKETHSQFCDLFVRSAYGASTTFVACQVFSSGKTVILNVGDSRAYKITEAGYWQQLSYDHILLNELVESENCESKDYAGMYYGLTDCLIADYAENDFNIFQTETVLKSGETLLLCSDGLTNYISAEKREAIWRKYSTHTERLFALKCEVKREAFRDDFSVVTCQKLDEC
ncbi:hypothetical protein PL75_00630 [Neisseria arctica]|uniref:PPM-type phosphatase domain-containing protein n=1 Tax=Neisseria arctica TaxID=1470200 RepID=A0A0J0YUW0_9NEIS|nr:protein phosphatase 2C domain-containing protein [Neisseria arctica]KLT73877.1 hypothetical protein PL75_00630 [Neisseria arctica]UOO86931.1 protein phosphatase 2C domain-containing protein [Neisseria arctica]